MTGGVREWLVGRVGSGQRDEARRVVRFAVVGGTNTALTFTVFHTLLRLLRDVPAAPGIAQLFGYGAGMMLGYLLNRSWTFGAREHGRAQAGRFIVAQSCFMLTSSAAVYVGVARLGLPRTPWWLAVTATTAGLDYLAQRLWVFRRRRAAPATASDALYA